MKIIEYSDKYAALVADMWNKSNSSWGNDSSVKTPEEVIQQEAASGNIKLYLAMDNEEVVGYCSFSEYRGDEGASYLPLLNVRPDYHGKKVGKLLILKVLEDAIASKWPRFDLYTWSGNIKAMPLYKKCGFFWEKKNNTVHLMNFIPYLYQTEALNEYMSKLDWYNDSIRKIDMNQDGELRGEFDMYRYDFKNDETYLSLEFERKGRGLTLIDTPEYRVEVKIDNQDLVFGESYEVLYELENKTDNPLNIKINGINNKNIEFDLQFEGEITSKEVVRGEFFVGKIEKLQEEGKTHPVVDADVYIDGKHANFRLAINPKYPIQTKISLTENIMVLNREYVGYLELENNYNEDKEVSVTFKNTFVTFKDVESVTLKAKEKRAISFTYELDQYGYYCEDLEVNVGTQTFKNKIKGIFNGYDNSFTVENDDIYGIVSGSSTLVFERAGRVLVPISDLTTDDSSSAIMPPEIGLPYTLELHNVDPEVEFVSDNEMRFIYESKEFANTKVILHASNYNGIMNGYYELVNEGDERELKLLCNVWESLSFGYVPYNGGILNINNFDGGGLSNLNQDMIDENWFFEDRFNVGVIWEGDVKINGWKLAFETELTTLKKGESITSPKITWSTNHRNVEDFRQFAGFMQRKEEIRYFDLSVNGGNPFFTEDYDVSFKNVRKYDLKGSMTIEDKTVDVFDVVKADQKNLAVSVELEDRFIDYDKKMFHVTGDVELQVKDGVHVVNNGVLEFKADQRYADSIYSLKKDGIEWLDSNYPTPAERVWWGSWVGGLNYEGPRLTDVVKQKEEYTVEFATVTDNYGNEWSGIKTSLVVKNEPKLKGYMVENFYLTLPGVNVLMNVSKLTNNTGKVQKKRTFERVLAVKGDEVDTNTIMHINNDKYRCSNKNVEGVTKHYVKYTSTRKDALHVFAPNNKRIITETQEGFNVAWDVYSETVVDQQSVILGNLFLVIDKNATEEELKDLKNIKVEV